MDKYAGYPQYKDVNFYILELDDYAKHLNRAYRDGAEEEVDGLLSDMCFKVYEAALNLDNIEDVKRVARHFHSIT